MLLRLLGASLGVWILRKRWLCDCASSAHDTHLGLVLQPSVFWDACRHYDQKNSLFWLCYRSIRLSTYLPDPHACLPIYLNLSNPFIRLITPPPNIKKDFGPLMSNIRGISGGFRLDFPKFESRILNPQGARLTKSVGSGTGGAPGLGPCRASNCCLESGTPRLGSGVWDWVRSGMRRLRGVHCCLEPP